MQRSKIRLEKCIPWSWCIEQKILLTASTTPNKNLRPQILGLRRTLNFHPLEKFVVVHSWFVVVKTWKHQLHCNKHSQLLLSSTNMYEQCQSFKPLVFTLTYSHGHTAHIQIRGVYLHVHFQSRARYNSETIHCTCMPCALSTLYSLYIVRFASCTRGVIIITIIAVHFVGCTP